MARCGCSKACTCKIYGGVGVSVAGTGSSTSPIIATFDGAAVEGNGLAWEAAQSKLHVDLATSSGLKFDAAGKLALSTPVPDLTAITGRVSELETETGVGPNYSGAKLTDRITALEDGGGDNGGGDPALAGRVRALEDNATGVVRVRAMLTADQVGIKSGTSTKVFWPTASRLYSQGITWASNGTDFTVSRSGLYETVCSGRFGPNGAGSDRAIWISPSSDASTGRFAWDSSPPGNASEWPKRGFTDTLQLAANTTYSVWVFHDAGTALDLKSFGGACSFSLTYLAPPV